MITSWLITAALFGQSLPDSAERPGGLPRGGAVPPARSGSMIVFGKVMLDDGSIPAEPVLMERVCRGRAKPEGYTDSKGRFSFELGRNTTLTSDASYGGSTDDTDRSTAGAVRAAERDLVGCELRASLAGYVSDVLNLSGRRVLDSPNLGTLLLHRRANVEGHTTSATSLAAPKAAKRAYQKTLKAKQPAAALRDLETAVAAYPKYAAAWYELGLVQERANRLPQAYAAYTKSIEADAKFIKPFVQMAGLWALEGKWKEASETSWRVIQLNPYDYPAAYYYHAVAAINLRDLDTAERSARAGMKIDTEFRISKLAHVLGVVLAQKHEVAGAVEQLRLYLKLAPYAADAEQVRSELAELEHGLAPPPKRNRFLASN